MIFSKTCEYAIKASVFIARCSVEGKRPNLKEISAEIESPEAFTAKVLQHLVKYEIVDSVKGATGGFEISVRKLDKIKLYHIVAATDGKIDGKTCALGLKGCSEKEPCPVHDKFKAIRSDIIHMLHNTSLLKLSEDLKEGYTVLRH